MFKKRIKHFWYYHRRLLTGMGCGLIAYALLPWQAETVTRALLAFNSGVVVYLVLIFLMMKNADQAKMLKYAHLEDEGGRTILLLNAVTAALSLTAIALEMGVSRELQGVAKTWHIALTVITIFLSWLFTHVLFALHYARMYYRDIAAKRPPCLIFPEQQPEPDYGDFVYFACIIGTSGQTADVSLASSEVRRIGLWHCTLSFFYNAAVLALMINIGASLISG